MDTSLELPALPNAVTVAARAFWGAQQRDVGLLSFIARTAMGGDYLAFVAQRVLAGEKSDSGLTPETLSTKAPGPGITELRKQRQQLMEMFLSRTVDNFQTYLVDIIREVLRKQPALLKSRQQTLTLEDILSHSTIRNLVHSVIEAKVNALSYEGFLSIREWCEARGIPLEVSGAEEEADLVAFLATRNIIAHNRCLVDERYLRAVRTEPSPVGQIRRIEIDDVVRCMRVLGDAVRRTDAAVARKFRLRKYRVSIPKVRGSGTKNAEGIARR